MRDEHFCSVKGKPIKVKLFKSLDGVKEFCGTLVDFSETLTFVTEKGEIKLNRNEIAKANLLDFED